MATDIRLDQQGGNWVVIEGAVVKCTAADLMLDSPGRRGQGGGPHRRALVHDAGDGLTVNFAGDYPGGVTVTGRLAVTGALAVSGALSVAGGLTVGGEITVGGSRLVRDAEVAGLRDEVDRLRQSLAALVELVGAVFVPAWRTKTEVEQGDDMGLVSPSAAQLGLVVEYEFDQRNPDFGHEDVISITPPAGTPVRPGTTVRVRVNLAG